MSESLQPLSAGWFWLICSVSVTIVVSNLAWLFRHPHPGRLGQTIASLASCRFAPWLPQAFRLLYYIGLPFAALFWGHDAVVGRILGLQPLMLPFLNPQYGSPATSNNWTDWTRDAGWALAVAVGTWIVLTLGWSTYRRALCTSGEMNSNNSAPTSGWILLREATYHEVHWAFYRNMPVITFGPYWGVWIGLAISAVEASLCPAWRHSLADPQDAPTSLMRAALSVTSGVLYLVTQNLWLAIIVHWTVTWGVGQIMRLGASSSHQTSDSMV